MRARTGERDAEHDMTVLKPSMIISAVMLAAACGGGEVPARQMAQSQSAIRAASEVGAENHPQAALHLKMAKDRATRADKLSRQGDNDAAKSLYEEAEADAALAL